MKLDKLIPTPAQVTKETLAVLAATVLAAFIISRFPALARFVQTNSVTLR